MDTTFFRTVLFVVFCSSVIAHAQSRSDYRKLLNKFSNAEEFSVVTDWPRDVALELLRSYINAYKNPKVRNDELMANATSIMMRMPGYASYLFYHIDSRTSDPGLGVERLRYFGCLAMLGRSGSTEAIKVVGHFLETEPYPYDPDYLAKRPDLIGFGFAWNHDAAALAFGLMEMEGTPDNKVLWKKKRVDAWKAWWKEKKKELGEFGYKDNSWKTDRTSPVPMLTNEVQTTTTQEQDLEEPTQAEEQPAEDLGAWKKIIVPKRNHSVRSGFECL